MGNGSHFHRGSGGDGDSFLEISIDYRGNRGNGDKFSSITAVVAVMETQHCVRDGSGDEFLSTCSSLVYISA